MAQCSVVWTVTCADQLELDLTKGYFSQSHNATKEDPGPFTEVTDDLENFMLTVKWVGERQF